MKKRNLFICLALGAITLSAVSIFVSSGSFVNNLLRVRSSGDNYSLDVGRNFIINKDEPLTFTTKTSLRNDVTFEYCGTGKNSLNRRFFYQNFYLKNISLIRGLQSITVEGITSGSLTVEYGWNENGYQNTGTINSSNNTFYFNSESPSYFTLRNNSNSTVSYTGVTLTYSCGETLMPSSYYSDLHFWLNNDDSSYSVYADSQSTLSYANIPSTYNGKPVIAIRQNGFYMCQNLSRISIPNSVTSIGSSAFYKCTSLQHIDLPKTLTSIGNSMFEYAGITDIVFPDLLTSIPDFTFEYCSSLQKVTLGAGTRTIGYSAFDSSSVEGVIFNEGLQSIGSFAFSDCQNLNYVNLPETLTNISNCAFKRCKGLTEFIIPNSVITVGHEVFDSCTNMKVCKIGSSVSSIAMYSFLNCTALQKILIPSSLATIGDSVFQGCSALTIYAEFSEAQSGWHTDWNKSNRPVIYDVTYSAFHPASGVYRYFLIDGTKWLYDELTEATDIFDAFRCSYTGIPGSSSEAEHHEFAGLSLLFDGKCDEDYLVELTANNSCLVYIEMDEESQSWIACGHNTRADRTSEDRWEKINPGDYLSFEYSSWSREGDDEAYADFTIFMF